MVLDAQQKSFIIIFSKYKNFYLEGRVRQYFPTDSDKIDSFVEKDRKIIGVIHGKVENTT